MNLREELAAGTDALRQGDARRARDHFTRCVQADRANTVALLGLAHAALQLNDEATNIASVDQLLAVEPSNVRALILKGDYLHRQGDTRSAATFYAQALRSIPPSRQLSPDLAQALQHAQVALNRYAAEYQNYLEEQLAAKGFSRAKSSPRFAQSVDIVLGKKKVFLQQPRYYYFPGLPQIQFYPRAEFPWLDAVEQATAAIQEELQIVMQDRDAFAPYVQGDPKRPRKDEAGMLNNPAWSAFFLWKNGEIVSENAKRCPRTMEALRDAPLARVANRSPSILFSLLKPGAHIPPHNGLINTRLICHLPLLVPPRCRFRVGNDEREWVEGKAWLFDDTIEHEAWNNSDATRVILLFDVWRPELTPEERDLVVALFAAIDAHSGRKPDWEI